MKLNSTQKNIVRRLFLTHSDSRKCLSKQLGLSQAALTLSVRPMLEEGLLLETGKIQTGKAGRTEELLSLNPEYGSYLGMDIRSNHYLVSMMDFSGNLILEDRIEKTEDLAVFLKASAVSRRLLGVGVTYHGSLDGNAEKIRSIREVLNGLGIENYRFVNNVEALADVYHLFHREEQNFLLVKYGPGLGSAIYVNGEKIRRKNGSTSELGHAFIQEGVTIENVVSFENLFHEKMEEKEGAMRLAADQEKKEQVLHHLALGLICSDALLALDKIVFSGIFLSDLKIKREVCEKMKAYDSSFSEDKVVVYQDYEANNVRKACLMAFLALFSESKED